MNYVLTCVYSSIIQFLSFLLCFDQCLPLEGVQLAVDYVLLERLGSQQQNRVDKWTGGFRIVGDGGELSQQDPVYHKDVKLTGDTLISV